MSSRLKKTISIITVCRNSSTTIGKTIESILSQRFEGMEYIIIDGASTDGTQNIIRSYGSGVDIFISEPDKGIAEAFNKGIALSSGEIIGIINSDDRLLTGALQKVRDFFAHNRDVEVLHADVLLYDGECLVKQMKPAGRWWYPWRLVLFNHPATFVKRAVYEKHGMFDPSYRIAMDVEIFLRWKRMGLTITYLPEPLVKMQIGGMSGRHAFKGYREVRRAMILKGLPVFLVNVLFLTRFAAQFFVLLQEKVRHMKSLIFIHV